MWSAANSMIKESGPTMSQAETRPTARSTCPECKGRLAVLRIIPGRTGSEYWTMRCTRCGGIHLDILKAAETADA